MASHSQSTHDTMARGPGNVFNPTSVVCPRSTAWRPSSICTKTFSRQPRMINQSSLNPSSAPSFGVTISSPEPTMTALMMSPGPICRNTPPRERGGGTRPGVAAGVGELMG